MKLYTGIMLDPPWPENGGGKIKRGADRHYSTIRNRDDITGVIVDSGAFNPANDAHMYMWVTNNYLSWGLVIMHDLGFRYVTNFPWTKPGKMGIGQYARGCHELLLFGVRGSGYAVCTVNPDGKRRTIRSDYLVGAPRVLDANGKIIHSAKPERSYELVEDRTVGPYLEMFSRRNRSGWDAWGNEVGKYDDDGEDE